MYRGNEVVADEMLKVEISNSKSHKNIRSKADSISKEFTAFAYPEVDPDSVLSLMQSDSALKKIQVRKLTPGQKDSISLAYRKAWREIYNELNKINIEGDSASQKASNLAARQARNFPLFVAAVVLGLIFFFLGTEMLKQRENLDKDILLRQNLHLPAFSKCCQSCGRVFNSIVVHATERNQSKNFHFCNSCYHSGSFVTKEIDLSEMLLRTQESLRKSGATEKKIEKVLSKIRGLDRWNPNRYEL